jgi:hypothetical protein
VFDGDKAQYIIERGYRLFARMGEIENEEILGRTNSIFSFITTRTA